MIFVYNEENCALEVYDSLIKERKLEAKSVGVEPDIFSVESTNTKWCEVIYEKGKNVFNMEVLFSAEPILNNNKLKKSK